MNKWKEILNELKTRPRGLKKDQNIKSKMGFLQKAYIQMGLIILGSILLWAGVMVFKVKSIREGRGSDGNTYSEALEATENGLNHLLCLNPESKICKDHLRNLEKLKRAFSDQ